MRQLINIACTVVALLAVATPAVAQRSRTARRVYRSLRRAKRSAKSLERRGYGDRLVKRTPLAKPGFSTLSFKNYAGDIRINVDVSRDAITTRGGELWIRPGSVWVKKQHRYGASTNNKRQITRESSPVVRLVGQRRALLRQGLKHTRGKRSPRTALRLLGAALRGGLSVEQVEYYREKPQPTGKRGLTNIATTLVEKQYLVGRNGKRIMPISAKMRKALLNLRPENSGH